MLGSAGEGVTARTFGPCGNRGHPIDAPRCPTRPRDESLKIESDSPPTKVQGYASVTESTPSRPQCRIERATMWATGSYLLPLDPASFERLLTTRSTTRRRRRRQTLPRRTLRRSCFLDSTRTVRRTRFAELTRRSGSFRRRDATSTARTGAPGRWESCSRTTLAARSEVPRIGRSRSVSD